MNFHAFLIKSNVFNSFHHRLKSFFLNPGVIWMIEFHFHMHLCPCGFSFLSQREDDVYSCSIPPPVQFLFPFGHCFTPTYSSSFAATDIFTRKADDQVLFGEDVKKKDMSGRIHPPWLQQTMCSTSISKGNTTCTFSKTVSCLWHLQADTDPSFCWVLQNTPLLFFFF